jgi:uncharacterized protein
MDDATRIKKDLKMFEDNIDKIKQKRFNKAQSRAIELASQYYEDAKYYLEKKDYFTSFGCINYAHGLLDAIIKRW